MSIIQLVKEGGLFIKGSTESGASPVIQVQSALLKAASPAFQVMLGANFLEGGTTYTEQSPLLLEGDPGKAFTEFCAILHQKSSYLPDYSLIADLTIVADKYQCLDVVRQHILMAIQPFFDIKVGECEPKIAKRGLSLKDTTCIAYILGDAQLFWRVSASMVVGYPIDGSKDGNSSLLDLVTSSLMSK